MIAGQLLADPLQQWTWRSPIPQGRTLTAVAYGGGFFVAVGDSGTIITSPDGYHWTNQSSGSLTYLRGVAYADGEFAAVGDSGVILVSSNAVAWSQLPTVTSNTLRGIAGDSTWRADACPQFIAVGDGGTAVQCLNNTQWSSIASDTTNALFSVAYFDTDYVAVGNNGTVTLDLAGFSADPPGSTGTSDNLYGVSATPDGRVVAVGDLSPPNYSSNGILYSLDFGYDEWTLESSQPNLWFPSQEFVLTSVCSGTNGFVAVGDTGHTLEFMYPGVVLTSSNGMNWVEQPDMTSENSLYGCCYGAGLYVLVGDAGGIVVSSNLVNWTEVTTHHRSAITAIACSSNLCIASAMPIFREYSSFPDFTTLVSSNGMNWLVSDVNLPTMVDLTADGNQFVGVSGSSVYTTIDGFNWETNSAFSNAFHGVRRINNEYIAVGDNGSIFTSPDGTNWSNDSISTSGSFYGVSYGNGVYVAAGSVGATSSDGINWSLSPTNPPVFITRLVYGNSLFVAAGYVGSSYYPNGQILTSQDGIHWQSQFLAPSGAISGLAYSGGTFLAISAYGTMFKSSDGTNWINTDFALPTVDGDSFEIYYNGLSGLSLSYLGDYATVCADQGTFLAAGLDGIMVQSGQTWKAAAINPLQATPGGFLFSYNQQIDVPYRIQNSSNLVNWQTIFNGIGSGQATNYLDKTSVNNNAEFYRLVSP